MKRELFLSLSFIGMACSGFFQPAITKTVAPSTRDPFGWPIFDSTPKQVGIVSTQLTRRGVVIALDTYGLPPGLHGVHIHAVPKCTPPTFATAGDHWNWRKRKHGHQNPAGHHAGDLGNLKVAADGKGQARFLVPTKDWNPKLRGGLPLVIHAAADNDRTDPSGKSGARIACGILYLRRD